MTDLAESPRPIINRMEDCGNGRHVGWWEYDGLLGDHHLLIEIQPDAVVFACCERGSRGEDRRIYFVANRDKATEIVRAAAKAMGILPCMLIRLTPTHTSASMHPLSGSEVTMTEAHKTIATFLKARNAKEMSVWEMGRADRLLTMGVSPEDVALRIMRARHGETAP